MSLTEQLKAQEVEKIRHEVKAEEIWAAMNDNQRHGVRFGLFPAALMQMAGYDAHKLACALMDVAQVNGGMRA